MKPWCMLAVAAALGCSRPSTLISASDKGYDGIQAYFEANPSASPNQRDRYGATALHVLLTRGDVLAMLALLSHAPDLEQKDAHDRTPLYLAAQLGNVDAVGALLIAGADPNSSNGPENDTPLHAAAVNGPLTIVEMLIAHGADVNRKNRWGQSPIFAAARGPSIQSESISRLLIDRGARLDFADKQGFTALHVAAAHDERLTILLLLDADADASALSSTGNTPLDIALENQKDLAAETLFEAGAPRHSSRLAPPLFQAAEVDDDLWALRLISNGVDPHFQFEGHTALDVARSHESGDTASLLAGR